jgi:hypothetical protein
MTVLGAWVEGWALSAVQQLHAWLLHPVVQGLGVHLLCIPSMLALWKIEAFAIKAVKITKKGSMLCLRVL